MAGRLEGRRILITGGASGIGRATATLFAAEGAKVAVLDRSAAAAAVAASVRGHAVTADLADAAQVKAAVEQAAAALGGLDGLVNAAGVYLTGDIASTTAEHFAHTLAVNLTGTFLAVQAAAPLLAQAEGASIVNIGSGVGLLPTGPGSIAYVASKGGVIAMTRALAIELAPRIRVNVVCPGAVDTPMTAGSLHDADGKVTAAVADRYALQRPGEAGEIAAAILFLTAHEASFVTGISLAVDGGRTFH